MSLKKDIVWRVALVYFAILALSIWIFGKVLYLQFVEKDKWEAKVENATIRDVKLPPNRGDIYADDMRLLASSIPYYEIRMDLKSTALTSSVFNRNIDSLSLCLSQLFRDKSKEGYKNELIRARKNGERFYLIKRKVNYIQLKKLKQFPIFRLGRYKGGFIYIQENERIRPIGNLASRTIGRISKVKGGNIVGIEGAYDPVLTGVEGVRLEQKLSGNVWMPINERNEIEPKDGKSVVTTIDIDLQDVAENALLKQLKLHKAHHGSAILMEVATGEVKAIVNLTDTFGTYMEYYNYAIGESTEPGSTFKLPVLIAAMEDGYIDLNDTVHTGKGIIQIYDKKIKDDSYVNGGWGTLTVKQVLEHSSNVGMAKLIMKYYKKQPQRLIDRLCSMDLNEKIGLEIKGEGKPVIRFPGDKLWSGISLAMIAHGYEVKLTPLQILTFYNAVANNGRMVKPRFVKELMYHGKLVKTYSTEVINPSICSRSTLRKARNMLEGVVEEGTASNLRNPYLKIAGKTGTTQIYNKKYGYKSGSQVSYQASFVGYFPADHPKYSCIVVINSPSKDVYYGNQVAGPVFQEIANKVYATDLKMQKSINSEEKNMIVDLPYSKNSYKPDLEEVLNALKIQTKDTDNNSEWVATVKQDKYIELEDKPIIQNLVPNVVSMGAKDAVYLLENAGLKVKILGRGSVKNQSIPPGSRINKGDVITLEMSFI